MNRGLFEDGGSLPSISDIEFVYEPLYHLKSDQIAVIEKMVNKELSNEKIQVNVHPVPFKGGIVLSVFMIPVIEMMM